MNERMRRARRHRALPVLAAIALVAMCVGGLMPHATTAATSTTVVTVSVPSATSLTPGGCSTGTAGVTDFGLVQPGASVVTPSDCVVQFGSSNDTAVLRVHQADRADDAMFADRWANLSSGTANDLLDIAAADGSTAWAVGRLGTLLKSTNGGTSWTAQTSGTVENLQAIDAASSTVAWATGVNGVILRTTDGTSWASRPASCLGTSTVDGVAAISATTAIVIYGTGGNAARTVDGGSTWTCANTGTALNQFAITMVDSSRGWVVGNSSSIRYTSDGGITWSAQTSPLADGLRTITARDANTAWSGGNNGALIATTNGGATWTQQVVPGLTGAVMVDANGEHLMAVSGTATAESLDGGATWRATPALTTAITEMANDNRSAGTWVVGVGGYMARHGVPAIPNFQASSADWSAGSQGMFGACLADATGGAIVDGVTWGEDTDNDCADGNADPWKAIPAISGAAGQVAKTAGPTTTAQARLRFGLRTSATQAPATYRAALRFEVLAPAV